MSDAVDAAQEAEARIREEALAHVKAAPGPAPMILDGVACCAECEEPIPEARLAALPGVGLCVTCAEELEGKL